MPYIKKEDRQQFKPGLRKLKGAMKNSVTPGDLNYMITMLCLYYLERKGIKYTFLNDVHGVLNCADNELYRRVTSEYENEKIKENGDL